MSYVLLDPTRSLELALQAEETANDSDKAFTIPAREIWQVLWIWIEFTTDGTAGDRQLELLIRDGSDDTVMQLPVGAVQAASLTRNYLLAAGMADLTTFRDTSFLTTPLPPLLIPGGYDLRIYDNNAVAAAADDMIVQMMVAKQVS